ncbi:MAG: GspE/PulE family protein [Deltaproteobacteria bacterium]|nr:GspE/PulE family protein [Deltaproteobacteria bacterium]MBW1920293.1 GspE/PulE family protein [Deltaproteobacteria bacterium]MBW1934631.1 GspE/PulE family protein [Deltaproteobacteria bacterium]MBW1977360.1 GspE/PulE family protein [Deltaproteobacteria bacterium]MBW2044454.1 GspE/PulE family protein [Deltaproteobacteria bacterium]
MAAIAKGGEQVRQAEKSLEEQLEFQRRLNKLTNQIHSAKDTNDILINLQDEILSLFDAERITVYVVDGIRKQIVSKMKTGDEVAEIRVPIGNDSISGYCAASGRVLSIANAYDENELKRINPQLKLDRSWDKKTGFKTKQILAAPISYNKYLLGVIQLINKKNGAHFTPEDQTSVQEIARVLGIAFFNNQKLAQRRRPTKFDYLIANNIITEKDLEQAISRARKAKKPVESLLMSDYQVSKPDIGKSLSAYYKTRFIPYDERMVIPGQILKNLRPNFLKSNVFVPVSQSGNKVVVAMENPDYLPARDTIRRLIPGKQFEYCVSLKEDIFKMIDLFFDVRKSDLLDDSGSIEDILGQLETGDESYEDEVERVSEEDGAIVQLVNKMIIDAYNRNASDIHIEPRQGKANAHIRFRIDGVCQLYQTIPYTFKRAVVSRIKIMSDLDISERRLPQDGKIKFRRYAPLDIELRVATIPTTGGNEDVVLRLLSTGEPIPLDKMGMSERNYDAFVNMITKPYGIVLVVGPTGSGKTTTLHAALRYINRPETKIWTAEDPVEITQEGLRQVQVHPKIGFDFATAMRSFLRADPDVIMVGEMRDHETVSMGIEASLTGHLVFSTLHTNSAPETISRLLDMGMDPFNFADALLGVLAQRLVRTLCKDCKEKYHPAREEFDSLKRAYEGDFDLLGYKYSDDLFLYRPEGCQKCGNVGYRGRTGIHELLVGTDEIKSLIQSRAKMEEIRKQAIKDGMTTLMQDGIRKTLLGETDLIQVRKVCIK